MQILEVSPFYSGHGGGIEIVADRLARHFAAEGANVTWVASLKSGAPRPTLADRLNIEPAKYWDPFEGRLGLPCPVWSPAAIARLWVHVKRADVVQIHDALYLPSIIAMLFSKVQHKPVVLTQHVGNLPQKSRVMDALLAAVNRFVGGRMLGAADQVVFIADHVATFFESFVRYRNPPMLVHNGVDHSVYHPAHSRTARNDLKLLFVGRFVEKKGIQHLRRCLDIPGTRWTFIGKGPLSPRSWSDLPGNVDITEGLSPTELVPYYQQADLLVLPSQGEGFPLVVQEALACGTPVLVGSEVAATCPNRDPRCVYDVSVSESNADTAVREAIMALAMNPDRLKQARPHAARLAAQWSWEACARSYMDIYERLCLDGNAR